MYYYVCRKLPCAERRASDITEKVELGRLPTVGSELVVRSKQRAGREALCTL